MAPGAPRSPPPASPPSRGSTSGCHLWPTPRPRTPLAAGSSRARVPRERATRRGAASIPSGVARVGVGGAGGAGRSGGAGGGAGGSFGVGPPRTPSSLASPVSAGLPRRTSVHVAAAWSLSVICHVSPACAGGGGHRHGPWSPSGGGARSGPPPAGAASVHLALHPRAPAAPRALPTPPPPPPPPRRRSSPSPRRRPSSTPYVAVAAAVPDRLPAAPGAGGGVGELSWSARLSRPDGGARGAGPCSRPSPPRPVAAPCVSRAVVEGGAGGLGAAAE